MGRGNCLVWRVQRWAGGGGEGGKGLNSFSNDLSADGGLPLTWRVMLSVWIEQDLAQHVTSFVVLWAGQCSSKIEVRSSCTPTAERVGGSFPSPWGHISAIPRDLSRPKVLLKYKGLENSNQPCSCIPSFLPATSELILLHVGLQIRTG